MSCRYAVTRCEAEGTVRYGVSAGYAETGSVMRLRFEDLTGDPEEIARFVDSINRGHLSPFHLRDAVEDFIGRTYCEGRPAGRTVVWTAALVSWVSAAKRAIFMPGLSSGGKQ